MLRITVKTKLEPIGYHEQVAPGATVRDCFNRVVGGTIQGTPKVNDNEVSWDYELRDNDVVKFNV